MKRLLFVAALALIAATSCQKETLHHTLPGFLDPAVTVDFSGLYPLKADIIIRASTPDTAMVVFHSWEGRIQTKQPPPSSTGKYDFGIEIKTIYAWSSCWTRLQSTDSSWRHSGTDSVHLPIMFVQTMDTSPGEWRILAQLSKKYVFTQGCYSDYTRSQGLQ